MERLRRRADFVAAAQGIKHSGKAFVVQARAREDQGPPRVGFTVTRKVGTAVERNRVRRRLREVVRRSATGALAAGYDYVLIGRRAALTAPFDRLLTEFADALRRLERGRRAGPGRADKGLDETRL